MLNFAIVLRYRFDNLSTASETNGLPASPSLTPCCCFCAGCLVIPSNGSSTSSPASATSTSTSTKLQEKAGVFWRANLYRHGTWRASRHCRSETLRPFSTLAITMEAVLVFDSQDGCSAHGRPVADFQRRERLQPEHFAGRGQAHIGLDSAVAIGHPVTLSVSSILVPIVVFLAVIIPGNKMVPLPLTFAVSLLTCSHHPRWCAATASAVR